MTPVDVHATSRRPSESNQTKKETRRATIFQPGKQSVINSLASLSSNFTTVDSEHLPSDAVPRHSTVQPPVKLTASRFPSTATISPNLPPSVTPHPQLRVRPVPERLLQVPTRKPPRDKSTLASMILEEFPYTPQSLTPSTGAPASSGGKDGQAIGNGGLKSCTGSFNRSTLPSRQWKKIPDVMRAKYLAYEMPFSENVRERIQWCQHAVEVERKRMKEELKQRETESRLSRRGVISADRVHEKYHESAERVKRHVEDEKSEMEAKMNFIVLVQKSAIRAMKIKDCLQLEQPKPHLPNIVNRKDHARINSLLTD